jgi:toluene monooxygenase system protein E
MSQDTSSRARPRRTFSAFGEVRRMPSEYEIVTQGQNWTTRRNRAAAFESNPSTPANLWFRTYRDRTPLAADDWEQFREPDSLTYQMYVRTQDESQNKIDGVLEEYAALEADAQLAPGWLAALGALYTPSRYLVHGLQQAEAYVGYLAPTSYLTNPAALSTADFLRRVTTIAYRTRELQLAHPGLGFGTERERAQWEDDPAWQPARRAIEALLVTYDWGEAFTALNLVLAPTLDEVLSRQFAQAARVNGDQVGALVTDFLDADNQRRTRWAAAAARFAVSQRPSNRDVLGRWYRRWAPLADEAAAGLAGILATLPEHLAITGEVLARATGRRDRFFTQLLDGADADKEAR